MSVFFLFRWDLDPLLPLPAAATANPLQRHTADDQEEGSDDDDVDWPAPLQDVEPPPPMPRSSPARPPETEVAADLAGRAVRKPVAGRGALAGTVTGRARGGQRWVVAYEDGAREELTREDLLAVLRPAAASAVGGETLPPPPAGQRPPKLGAPRPAVSLDARQSAALAKHAERQKTVSREWVRVYSLYNMFTQMCTRAHLRHRGLVGGRTGPRR